MGSPTSEAGRNSGETQHTVTLTKGFYVGKYAVTQGEYLALMGNNPSYFTTRDTIGNAIPPDLNHPVEQVSWDDATNYCAHLTQQEQVAGRLPSGWVYRLPTESEREYACRAGTTTAFHYGSALHGGMANFYDYYEYDAATGNIYVPNPAVPSLPRTTTVGSYQPNAWGLYDMHGNVWEWCRDWYGTYPTGSVIDPQGAPSGSHRNIRGGCWDNYGDGCRSAFRVTCDPPVLLARQHWVPGCPGPRSNWEQLRHVTGLHCGFAVPGRRADSEREGAGGGDTAALELRQCLAGGAEYHHGGRRHVFAGEHQPGQRQHVDGEPERVCDTHRNAECSPREQEHHAGGCRAASCRRRPAGGHGRKLRQEPLLPLRCVHAHTLYRVRELEWFESGQRDLLCQRRSGPDADWCRADLHGDH